MIIETGELRLKDRHYTGEEPGSILELESEPYVRAVGPIRYDLAAKRLENDLLVQGRLALTMEFMCARCGEWFRKPLQVADFVRSFPVTAENESIDLTDDIREDILLALPSHVVCSDVCRGRCSQCGAHLNRRQCGCRPAGNQAAWSVLERLRIK